MSVVELSTAETVLSRRTRLAISIGFALLLLAGVAAIIATLRASVAESWSAHSLSVRQSETELLGLIRDAEAGQRGYLLTGDPTYLTPFNEASDRLPKVEDALRALTQDNAEQHQRLADIEPLITAKMAELSRIVELKRRGQSDEALRILRTNEGRDLMVRIRTGLNEFDGVERDLLAKRQLRAIRERGLLMVVILIAVTLAGALAALVGRSSRRDAKLLSDQNETLIKEIASRERVESQLRQAQKMEALGQLTGGVAHDFNNMLAIIVGNLDMLLRRLPGEKRLTQMAENALEGAKRAAALTQRLLAFSRLQPLNPKAIDVNRCVTDMSEMLRRTLGEHISVETVLGGGLWPALIDRPQLESAILNLAVNARDAMPDGGRLTLETANAALDQAYAYDNVEVTPGQYVLVAVTDTGGGMTPDVIEKAFDPFFTTKRVGEGTGLGLSQVHGFLKQSRGHVKIYSEVGVGTTVKLYLPRDSSGLPAEKSHGPDGHPPLEKRLKILVVEDEEGVRNYVVNALEEIGFEAIEADSGATGLDCIGKHPDLAAVLTDVVMPGMTGRQMIEEAHRARPDLRVLYMTGYTRNAIVHNGVLDSGTRLLSKPFTLDQLEAEMRSLVADIPD